MQNQAHGVIEKLRFSVKIQNEILEILIVIHHILLFQLHLFRGQKAAPTIVTDIKRRSGRLPRIKRDANLLHTHANT